MLRDLLEKQGTQHRYWRIGISFLLAPFAVYAFLHSGWMTVRLGDVFEESWDLFCLAIALAGFAIRLHIAGHGQAEEADELLPRDTLQTTGFYSIMRHPLVVANFLIVLAGSLLLKDAYYAFLVVLVSIVYYERVIVAGERILQERFGDQFRDWAAVTPIALPKFGNWKKPYAAFDRAAAFRRETPNFVLIVLMFFVYELLEGIWIERTPLLQWAKEEPHWLALLAFSLLLVSLQFSALWSKGLLALSSIALLVALTVGLLGARESPEERAMAALKAGGNVILLRHSFTSGADQPVVNVDDCSTQRNLTDHGRTHARALGDMLRKQEVRVARTVTSQFCRAKETAEMMGMQINETMWNLNEQHTHLTFFERLFGHAEKDEKIFRAVRHLISDWKGRETLLLVSHSPIIAGLTFSTLEMGEGLVLRPAPYLPLGFRVIGKLPMPDKMPQ